MASAKSGRMDERMDRRWLFYSPPSGFLRNRRGTNMAIFLSEQGRHAAKINKPGHYVEIDTEND